MSGLNLTRDEAATRASLISVNHYDVELDLTQGDQDFHSITTITFDADEGGQTFADLVSNKVESINLNGSELGADAHQDYRIALGGLQHTNTLRVDAWCQYMHTGEGLHRFVDSADGETYCYSQFEVPDARRVFTTFEQPDLKATFTFTVTVPEGWTVFSNSVTPTPDKHDGVWTYHFEPTDRIATYVTAVVAGPYQGETSQLVSSDGRTIPMGVYCRASLKKYLDENFILDITKQGFAFYEAQYGIPYPFSKYDQIFVPEYNAGAMENAGCITFRDEYIFRSKPTAWQQENLANTILHELAHMWFGDLVTMKWWNDLWLNESFAEFMSHLACAEGTAFTNAWTGFLLRKDWGLRQDQMPTTHPIKAEIRDLADVEVNFDGITYAKGAAVLRQLVTYVGRDAFFQGLNTYLTSHAHGNATLDDLLRVLEQTSGRDLSAWTTVWLEQAGVTILRPEVSATDGVIDSLTLKQEIFTPGSSLRPHRLAVAGYSLGDDHVMHKDWRTELDADGAETLVSEATGQKRSDVILVNDGDLAYAKIRLDADSLDFATGHIAAFADSLTRNTILAAAWDMTRDGELAARDFLSIALATLPVEDNMAMAQLSVSHIRQAARTYVSAPDRHQFVADVAERLLLLARTAPAASDAQRVFVEAFAQNAWTPSQLEALSRLFNGTDTLEGLTLDIDLKWTMLFSLVRGGQAGEADIVALETADATMTGAQNAAEARAAQADANVKHDVWDKVLHDPTIPNDTRWAMAMGFWAQGTATPELYTPFVADYFNALEDVWAANTFHTAEDLVTLMYPDSLSGYSSVDVVAAGQQWLREHTGAPAALVRIVRERASVAERAVAAQQVDSQARPA